MSFRVEVEASGSTGANKVTIKMVEHEGPPHVCIAVRPLNGEHPTMPILPRGSIYVDREGFEYTILNVRIVEYGPKDGERSFWKHEYLALAGAHTLSGLHH